MANLYFQFKQFTIYHDRCAMKVTTDACLFGAWCAEEIKHSVISVQHVLDIGAGTGLLSLMIAQKNNLHIDAIEIDKDAAEQAGENILTPTWKERIQIIQGDILNITPGKDYDCIVCNPPFYENEIASERIQKNIAHHSLQLTIVQVLDVVKHSLKTKGIFFLLIPEKRLNELELIFKKKELFIHKKVVVYLSDKNKRVMIKGSCEEPKEVQNEEIYVWNKEKKYSDEFINLMKDYYLNEASGEI